MNLGVQRKVQSSPDDMGQGEEQVTTVATGSAHCPLSAGGWRLAGLCVYVHSKAFLVSGDRSGRVYQVYNSCVVPSLSVWDETHLICVDKPENVG